MGEIMNYLIINGIVIVKILVFVEENIDNVDKKLNKLFIFLCSKYYLFVSDLVVIGIDVIEDIRVILRIFVEIILGEGFVGVWIICKEV